MSPGRWLPHECAMVLGTGKPSTQATSRLGARQRLWLAPHCQALGSFCSTIVAGKVSGSRCCLLYGKYSYLIAVDDLSSQYQLSAYHKALLFVPEISREDSSNLCFQKTWRVL